MMKHVRSAAGGVKGDPVSLPSGGGCPGFEVLDLVNASMVGAFQGEPNAISMTEGSSITFRPLCPSVSGGEIPAGMMVNPPWWEQDFANDPYMLASDMHEWFDEMFFLNVASGIILDEATSYSSNANLYWRMEPTGFMATRCAPKPSDIQVMATFWKTTSNLMTAASTPLCRFSLLDGGGTVIAAVTRGVYTSGLNGAPGLGISTSWTSGDPFVSNSPNDFAKMLWIEAAVGERPVVKMEIIADGTSGTDLMCSLNVLVGAHTALDYGIGLWYGNVSPANCVIGGSSRAAGTTKVGREQYRGGRPPRQLRSAASGVRGSVPGT